MSTSLGRTVGLLAAMAAFSATSSATVLFSNGLPNQSGGADLNLFLQADNFTLSAGSSVNLIRFWTLQSAPSDYTGTTHFSILSDAFGTPGTNVFTGSFVSTQTATGQSTLGLNEYLHEGTVNFSLSAGTYWLLLHNGPTTTEPSTTFYWAFSNDQTGDSHSRELALGDSSEWLTNSAELAFELEANPIPEPSTWLLTTGCLALFALRRNQRKTQ